MESIWTRAPGRRGPAPTYTRSQLARAGVALADADGLSAATMRAVAAAAGAAPASLYRYVRTRDELLELMIDEVNGELILDRPRSGHWLTDLLALARQARAIYLRHPWLLDALAGSNPLGPNAIAFLEHAMSVLQDLDVPGPTKLEAVAVMSGIVRLLARTEIDQRAAGGSIAMWQAIQAEYLAGVLASGDHPHLAAALGGPSDADTDALFDRVVTRVLSGLLDFPGNE